MPDDSTVTAIGINSNGVTVNVGGLSQISVNLQLDAPFFQRGHHMDTLIPELRCLCGGAVYGYEQPALVPTGNATTHVHCVNEACAWYMRTLELPNWIELVWGGVDARLRESGAA